VPLRELGRRFGGRGGSPSTPGAPALPEP